MAVKTSNSCATNVDRISLLPDPIIEIILMCLPLQEAVRTSALSMRWRYIWTKIPRLVFDNSFCNSSIRDDKSRRELMKIIYQVLRLHRSSILKFTRSLSRLLSCLDIDRLILFMSNNGIKDISLFIWKGERYQLPSYLLTCVQLEHLNLGHCIFRPQRGFEGFTALVSLEFHDVLITGDVCSKLISSCPLLERLTLETLADCNHIDIVAPSLRFFHYVGVFMSISFKNTPHLETLLMYLTQGLHRDDKEESEEKIVVPFNRLTVVPFNSLTALTHLESDYCFLKYVIMDGVPKRIADDMIHLKTLKLYNIFFGKEDEALTLNALGLIRRSPNLEKITISAYASSLAFDPAVAVLDIEDFSDISLNQLREVEMKGVSGMKTEMIIIEVILAKSPILKRMIIKPNMGFDEDNGLRILKEMTQFRRASPLAQITYISPEEDQD